MVTCQKPCTKATAPINIPANCAEHCGSGARCQYSYNYSITDLDVTNEGTYLSIKESNAPQGVSSAKYNGISYKVNEIRIYQPSLHTFDGETCPAEIIIVHNQIYNGTTLTNAGPLLVCLPITSGDDSTSNIPGAGILTEIITIASTSAPNITSNPATIPTSSSNFSLNQFIPKKGFYVYKGTLPYSVTDNTTLTTCDITDVQYIVFYKTIKFTVSEKTLGSLGSIIKQPGNPPCTPWVNTELTCGGSNPGLIYNKYLPKLTGQTDDIYIDCQPVNESGETMVQEPSSSSTIWGASLLDKVMDSGIVSMFFGLILMILLYYYSKKFFIGIGVTPSSVAGKAASADANLAKKISKSRKSMEKARNRASPDYEPPTRTSISHRIGRGIGRAGRSISNAGSTVAKNLNPGSNSKSPNTSGSELN